MQTCGEYAATLRTRVAHHEAAHAVVGHLFGVRLHGIVLRLHDDETNTHGVCRSSGFLHAEGIRLALASADESDYPELVRRLARLDGYRAVMYVLAGFAAEHKLFPDDDHEGDWLQSQIEECADQDEGHDVANAFEIASLFARGRAGQIRFIRLIVKWLDELFRDESVWKSVAAVAAPLASADELKEDDLYRVIFEAGDIHEFFGRQPWKRRLLIQIPRQH